MNKQINIILGITFLLLIGVRIYVSDSVSTAGLKLAELNKQSERLEHENERLKTELLSLTSLNSIESRALLLGYNTNKFEFLEPQSLALR